MSKYCDFLFLGGAMYIFFGFKKQFVRCVVKSNLAIQLQSFPDNKNLKNVWNLSCRLFDKNAQDWVK